MAHSSYDRSKTRQRLDSSSIGSKRGRKLGQVLRFDALTVVWGVAGSRD